MEHEDDSDTNCNWCTWNQRIGKQTGRLGDKMTSGNHLDYSIIIGQNTEKSPGDLRRFVVTQNIANTGVKNSLRSKIIIILDNFWFVHRQIVYVQNWICENETYTFLRDFEIQTNHQIQARTAALMLINKKKKNLLCSGYCHSSSPLSEHKRKWKDRQILGPC